METQRYEHGDMDMAIWTWRHGDITVNAKRKTEAQAIFLSRLPFAHCANRSLSFVRLLMKKQLEDISLQTD